MLRQSDPRSNGIPGEDLTRLATLIPCPLLPRQQEKGNHWV